MRRRIRGSYARRVDNGTSGGDKAICGNLGTLLNSSKVVASKLTRRPAPSAFLRYNSFCSRYNARGSASGRTQPPARGYGNERTTTQFHNSQRQGSTISVKKTQLSQPAFDSFQSTQRATAQQPTSTRVDTIDKAPTNDHTVLDTTPEKPKTQTGPTLRYVVPKRGDVEKENVTSPNKKKRKKMDKSADPKQVTLSQVFRGTGVPVECIVDGDDTDDCDGITRKQSHESVDDDTLLDTGVRKKTHKKTKTKTTLWHDAVTKPKTGIGSLGFDDLISFDCCKPKNLELFGKALTYASAVGIGVLLRDTVGTKKFGFRSNLTPNPSAEDTKAATKAARAAGGGGPVVEGGRVTNVCNTPVAIGVVLLGSPQQVKDAGDGCGSPVFVFPFSATQTPGSDYTLAGGEATRSVVQNVLKRGIPIVTHHTQIVVKWLSSLNVPVNISKTSFLDSRTMAWLAAPDASHEDGVDKVNEMFPDVSGTNKQSHANAMGGASTALGKFRLDLHLAAALVQRFRRQSASHQTNDIETKKIASTTLRECRISAVLGTLERVGIGFDLQYAKRVVEHFRVECVTLEKQASQLVKTPSGDDVNLAAPAQVAEALYVTLKLPPPAVKGAGWGPPSTSAQHVPPQRNVHLPQTHSTRDEVLRALASGPNSHPFPGLVLKFRAALRATSVCASYVTLFEKENGDRLRCEWNNTRTATGRLSSSNPNLQAVGSITSADGNLSLRSAFVAPKGKVLLASDYRQIELRVLAHLAGDERLLAILNPQPNDDGHATSSQNKNKANDAFERIWNAGLGADENAPVSKTDRAKAKTTVYGLLYGQGTNGLASKLGVSVEEARLMTNSLFNAFPRLKRFIKETKQTAKNSMRVYIPGSARVRPLPGFASADNSMRAEAERKAVNTLIQGTASDLIKVAMERWHRLCSPSEVPAGFDPSKAQLIAQIHDELMFEVDADVDVVRNTAGVVRLCMEGAAAELNMDVKTPTKTSAGQNWAGLMPINEWLLKGGA